MIVLQEVMQKQGKHTAVCLWTSVCLYAHEDTQALKKKQQAISKASEKRINTDLFFFNGIGVKKY